MGVRQCIGAVLVSAVLGIAPAFALEPGAASGTVTLDKVVSKLTHAASAAEENLFDSAKQDTIIAVSDRPIKTTSPADRTELGRRAGAGEIVVVIPRFDGTKLVNVGVGVKGESGILLLPGAWFQSSISQDGSGSLKLAPRTFEGHTHACDLQFHAKKYAPPVQATSAPAQEPPAPVAEAPLPPATTSNISPKAGAAMVIEALMQKDEHQALELIKLGADPNGSDAYGIRVLNYAVMMCMPNVVQALVQRKADLQYERAPGMTIMTEAGACPAAATILKKAGAR